MIEYKCLETEILVVYVESESTLLSVVLAVVTLIKGIAEPNSLSPMLTMAFNTILIILLSWTSPSWLMGSSYC